MVARLGTPGRSPVPYTTAVVVLCLLVSSVAGIASQPSKVDTSTLGPDVGQHVPDFSGTDQFGRQLTLASSLGAKGTMLVFFRSADW
jgi:cytochrome oxidase Cu insertion factor (SCO1/SenC/PrrC family)